MNSNTCPQQHEMRQSKSINLKEEPNDNRIPRIHILVSGMDVRDFSKKHSQTVCKNFLNQHFYRAFQHLSLWFLYHSSVLHLVASFSRSIYHIYLYLIALRDAARATTHCIKPTWLHETYIRTRIFCVCYPRYYVDYFCFSLAQRK